MHSEVLEIDILTTPLNLLHKLLTDHSYRDGESEMVLHQLPVLLNTALASTLRGIQPQNWPP
jgi:hypothetical protein